MQFQYLEFQCILVQTPRCLPCGPRQLCHLEKINPSNSNKNEPLLYLSLSLSLSLSYICSPSKCIFFVWLTDEFYEKVLGDPVMLGDVANHLDDQGVLRTKQSGSYRETQRGGGEY